MPHHHLTITPGFTGQTVITTFEMTPATAHDLMEKLQAAYDEVIRVSNDEAFQNARLLARLEGIPGGISSGAALVAAFRQATMEENAGKTIVAIIPSFAERYLSTALFEGL